MAVPCRRHGVVLALEEGREQRPVAGIIVHDQNRPLVHAPLKCEMSATLQTERMDLPDEPVISEELTPPFRAHFEIYQ